MIDYIKKNELDMISRDLTLIFGDAIAVSVVDDYARYNVIISYRGKEICMYSYESIMAIGSLIEVNKIHLPQITMAIYDYITHNRKND